MHPPRHKKLKANRFKATHLPEKESRPREARTERNTVTVKSRSKMVALNPTFPASDGLLVEAVRQNCQRLYSRVIRPVTKKVSSWLSQHAESAFRRMDTFLLSDIDTEEAVVPEDELEPPARSFHFDKTWHDSEEFFKRINSRFTDIESHFLRIREKLQMRISGWFMPAFVQPSEVILEVVNADVLIGRPGKAGYSPPETCLISSIHEPEPELMPQVLIEGLMVLMQYQRVFKAKLQKKWQGLFSRLSAFDPVSALLFKSPSLQMVSKTKLPKTTLSPADPGYP